MAGGRSEYLTVHAPGAPERRFEVRGYPVRIGRGDRNQVVLSDQYVSAVHAEIVEHDGRRHVRDLGSTNGTELNGRPLAPNTLAVLSDGNTLRIGSCTLTYQAGPAADGALPAPGTARRRGVAGALLRSVLVVAVLLALLVGAAWAASPPRVSLLVLGSDARPDELQRGQSGRTDTLLTVVADRPPAGAAIISLPRDLWVDIPGVGAERINAAHQMGGPEAAKGATSQALGVPVDRYLLVGMQGVREVVDAAGGVEIEVEAPIHDPAYPTDDYGTIAIDIPAGRQRMDGETALRYVRTRHQDSDFGRVARQQQLMVALRNSLLQPVNWWRLPAVLVAVRGATETDLGPLDMVAVGLSLAGSPGEPERLVVGPSLVEGFMGAGGAYLLRPKPSLHQEVAVFLSPSEARVEVLNGTQTPGLARRAAETLHTRGLQAVRYGDAGQPAPATIIEAGPGAMRAGRYAASLLNVPPDLVRESGVLPVEVDVRVTLGEEPATP